jgi:tetratricopeptide (TPR) repeat protein
VSRARARRSLGWLAVCAALAALACQRPDPREVLLERGQVALAIGDPEDAEDAYQQLLSLRPNDPAALLGLARTHLARHDGEAALEALARLNGAAPGYLDAHAPEVVPLALEQAARQSLESGDTARALERLARLDQLDPGRPGVAELRVQTEILEAGKLYAAGRIPEAEALASRAFRARLSGADAALALAHALAREGRLDMAISILSDARARHMGDRRLTALMDRLLEIRYPEESTAPRAWR